MRPSAARLTGWIDLDKLTDDARIIDAKSAGSRVCLEGGGVELVFDRTSVDWHAENGRIVLLLGRPTSNGRRLRASEVAAFPTPAPIDGRFALVDIDQNRKAVQLRTDRFGVWPLCWAREGKRLCFSDRADEVPVAEGAGIDAQSLLHYVYFHTIPAPRTVFRGVSRIEPATVLSFDSRGEVLKSWWSPTFRSSREGSESELVARFSSALRKAVAFEAQDSSIGCFLSGGTDSSTVAGVLKEIKGVAATFSMGFDEAGYDEMEYARIAARHFGTEHHEHYVTTSEMVAAIPAVAAHYDQPFGNSSAVPAFICARLARDHGVLKLLAGDGGDELFGGNARYARQKIFEAWWRLSPTLRRTLSACLGNGLVRTVPIVRKAASYVDQASVPMPARLETYNLLTRFGPDKVFQPAFLQSVDTSGPEALQAEVYARNVSAPFVDRMMAYDWRFTLSDNDLPKVVGTTQLASLDVGFPLLADEIVDLSMRLSPADKVRGLRLRHFFKMALEDFLPPEIIRKKKHGFGLPVGQWLLKDVPFRTLARESLAQLGARGLIRPSLVDDLFSKHLEEHPGYYGEMAWVLMMLEQWLAAHQPRWRVR